MKKRCDRPLYTFERMTTNNFIEFSTISLAAIYVVPSSGLYFFSLIYFGCFLNSISRLSVCYDVQLFAFIFDYFLHEIYFFLHSPTDFKTKKKKYNRAKKELAQRLSTDTQSICVCFTYGCNAVESIEKKTHTQRHFYSTRALSMYLSSSIRTLNIVICNVIMCSFCERVSYY